MGFIGGAIMSAILMGMEYCFKKLKTRIGTIVRFCILGVLCAFNLFLAIFMLWEDPEFWQLSIGPGALFCLFIWRFVWDGILICKNNFDKPEDTTQSAQQKQQDTQQQATQNTRQDVSGDTPQGAQNAQNDVPEE